MSGNQVAQKILMRLLMWLSEAHTRAISSFKGKHVLCCPPFQNLGPTNLNWLFHSCAIHHRHLTKRGREGWWFYFHSQVYAVVRKGAQLPPSPWARGLLPLACPVKHRPWSDGGAGLPFPFDASGYSTQQQRCWQQQTPLRLFKFGYRGVLPKQALRKLPHRLLQIINTSLRARSCYTSQGGLCFSRNSTMLLHQ